MKVRNDLRGDYILSLSKPETTTYGLNSFSYPGFEWYFKVTQDFLALPGAVARFFVTRGIIAGAEGTSLVGGSGGVLP